MFLMKFLFVLGLFVFIAGCAQNYLHTKSCVPADDEGYQYCRHYVEFSTEVKVK